jgi:hypothetical protein
VAIDQTDVVDFAGIDPRTPIKHQLVIQWPASSIDDYDEMVEIESMLLEKFAPGNEVDGHDAGSGEVNIFIFTDEPMRTFEEHDVWPLARVAYRHLEATEYTPIWPKGLTEFDMV